MPSVTTTYALASVKSVTVSGPAQALAGSVAPTAVPDTGPQVGTLQAKEDLQEKIDNVAYTENVSIFLNRAQWFVRLESRVSLGLQLLSDRVDSVLQDRRRELANVLYKQEVQAVKIGLITIAEDKDLPTVSDQGSLSGLALLAEYDLTTRAGLATVGRDFDLGHFVELKLNFLERELIKAGTVQPFERVLSRAEALQVLLALATEQARTGQRVVQPPRDPADSQETTPPGPGPGSIVDRMWLRDP